MRPTPWRAVGCLLAAAAMSIAGPAAWAATVGDARPSGVEWSATINGTDASLSDANDPVDLVPADGAQMSVTLSNSTDQPVRVRSVRVQGRVLGLTFFRYSTRVDMLVEPGTSESRQFTLDTADLRSQATGRLPASVALLDDDGRVVRSQPITLDVQGSLASVYGVFGLAVAGLTGAGLVVLLLRLATGHLPGNRWRRASRFGAVGVGVGLTSTFSLSALQLRAPDPTTWATVVLLCAGIAFFLGYVTPAPAQVPEEDGDTLSDDVAPEPGWVGSGGSAPPQGDKPGERPGIVTPRRPEAVNLNEPPLAAHPEAGDRDSVIDLREGPLGKAYADPYDDPRRTYRRPRPTPPPGPE